MQHCLILFAFFSLFTYGTHAQAQGSTNYHSPLGIPSILASNFGELRPNHFHMGIDFKTNGKIGYNLYSIEKGFVSRIKVSPYGYGKVIYIDHPNGVTSVYAHCSEFKDQIDSIVRVTQIREENYAVEIFPKKNEIRVARGQVIGISGNTGGSTAPHLHFEIRDTKTEHALNPLVYGFDLPDTKKPEIRGVKVYSLTQNGYRVPSKNKRYTVSKGGSGYYVSNNTITIPANYASYPGGIGFAFDVIDRMDGANNQCGLYGSYLIVDGDTIFGQETNRVPFESSRYVNCHKDYEEYAQNKRKFHKCFRTRENDLPIYHTNDLGIFPAESGKTYKVKYIAYDVKNNRSELSFTLKVESAEPSGNMEPFVGLDYLKPDQSMAVSNGDTEVEFGIGTVYEPIKIDQAKIGWTIGERDIPVHKAYRIMIDAPGKRDGKDYIEIVTAKGKRRTLDVEYDGDLIICESKYFGSYSLKRDTIAPSVSSVNFTKSSTLYTRNLMQWRISDIGTGLADYDLFIDGQWKLVEYEYKTGLITYTREVNMTGEKDILVRVVDDCGNVKEWKTRMNFK
jgi:hypothetical protein